MKTKYPMIEAAKVQARMCFLGIAIPTEVKNIDGEMVQVATAEEIVAELEKNADAHIHMPSPSYWPIILAFGLPVTAFGVIFSIPVAVVGGLIILLGMYGWALEPSTAPDDDIDPPTSTSKEVAHVG